MSNQTSARQGTDLINFCRAGVSPVAQGADLDNG
jgi:hypothetical protein